MYKSIIFLTIFFCSNTLYASLLGDDNVKEIILPTHKVEIDNKLYFDKSVLYDALSIENKSMFEFWKEDNPTIKDKLLPTLNTTLHAFYNSEGFYDAEFSIEETNTTVYVHITENRPVIIKEIKIISDYDIKEFITFNQGEIFQAKKFIAIKSKIKSELLKSGYCSAELESKAYVDLDKHSVEINYLLKKGGVCTFGKVTVKGTESIDDEVIESRVRAVEGRRFNSELVQDTSAALYGLQAFDSVFIGVDRKFYNVVPVDIVVKEISKPYHFEAGLGYDSYVGPRVHSSLTKYNFYGNAQKLNIKLAWSRLEQTAVVNFYRPIFMTIYDYHMGIGADLSYTNLEYDGFQEEKGFFRVYLEHITERSNLRVGIASEVINITALDNLKVGDELRYAVNEGQFVLTYPYVNFVYDARDSKLNPKFGYYFSAYLETGLSDEESSTYYKTLIEGRLIHSFDKATLSAVGKIGIVDEDKENSLPESKYFFAGGAYSNRAYGFREIGVIVSPSEDSINGASTWANLSFEVNYPIMDDLYGAVFSDNTLLTGVAYDFSGDVISSAGIGVRYMTPMGPFKLDIGMNVADRSQYGISFQIGQSF